MQINNTSFFHYSKEKYSYIHALVDTGHLITARHPGERTLRPPEEKYDVGGMDSMN